MIVDTIEVTYDFTDEHGVLRYQEVRRPGKKFSLRRPDGNGGWINNLDGVTRVLYGLPELRRSAEPIFWVEGPKDVETLRGLGLIATTCAGGVNGWCSEFAQEFQDRYLVVLRDNDTPGLDLRDKVVGDSRPYAKRVVSLELPGVREKGDLTDWLGDGHTLGELLALVEAAEIEQPALSVATADPAPSSPNPKANDGLPKFPEIAWTGPFREYRDIVGPSTEAPDEFHWAVLFQTIGLAIGRRRYLCTPRPLYPNSFIMVIAPTGDPRKSTALEFGYELWPHLGVTIKVVSGLLSAEGLYEVLKEVPDTRVLLFEDEGRSLLAAAARPGTRSMLPQLCRLYRCPDEAQLVRRQGVLSAVRPFLSLITATTPTAIHSALAEEAVTGGFLNRCMVITGAPKPWLAHPEPPPHEHLEAFAASLRPLAEQGALLSRAPRVDLDPEAYDRWTEWYLSWRKTREDYTETEQALTARTQDVARKVALVYCLARDHDQVSLDDLEIGIAIADHGEALSRHLLTDLILPRATLLEARILSILRESPQQWMKLWNVQGRIGGNYTREEFAKAISILEDLDEVALEQRQGRRGPPGKVVRLAEGVE